MRLIALTAFAAIALAACSPPAEKAAAPGASEQAAATAQPQVQAPAGEYKLDPNHASLAFRVNHVGLSNYTARFTRFDGTVNFDPANPTATTVAFTVNPGSVATDAPSPADYRASHAPRGRNYPSWNEDLARSPEFFNAGQFPEATFRSTRVEQTGPGTARVTGDLTLRGQTHPITLDVSLVGSTADRFGGGPAIGFSATGKFNRSQFGFTYPPVPAVGDEVTLQFDGEFVRPPPAPQGAKAKN
jgi:polyisoprenoid-binding protein YceI